MSFDLCLVKTAGKPYFIENISTNIYSIEELCFYLYHNIFLIDESIVNEYLCDWIRDELGLKQLYKTLYMHLEKGDGIASFVLPIFREIGYLTTQMQRAFAEELGRVEAQPEDVRQKLKGDYLVSSGMYAAAVHEYEHLLKSSSPSNQGAVFYAGVWNNLGSAYARQFRFREAGDCYLEAWKLSSTKEMLRRYVSVLPLFLSQQEYEQRLSQIGADKDLIGKIQQYNAQIAGKAQEVAEEKEKTSGDIIQQLSDIKTAYRRSVKR